MDVADRLAHQGIYVPTSATIHGSQPKWRCNAPGCDAVFFEEEDTKRVRHAAMHAKQDVDEIRAEGERLQRRDVFGEGDPEKQSWMRRRLRQLVGKVENPLDPKHY